MICIEALRVWKSSPKLTLQDNKIPGKNLQFLDVNRKEKCLTYF